MQYRSLGIAIAAAATLVASPLYAEEPRAVIELFTSQGCSSCPPADKLLTELSKDPTLITMSLAVDYWDYLGWKDTLALHGHSERQRAYARARSDRQVYTPQVVVNGVTHVLGSDKNAIENAIAQTRRTANPLALPVKVSIADGKLTVDVPAAKDSRTAGEVWLCPITRDAAVTISRGENHGNTFTYHNVVRSWIKLGDWSGKAASFTIPVADVGKNSVPLKDIDSVAVVLQSGAASAPGVMLGAATAALH